MHNVWKRVRGPFYHVSCREHKWESYDVQNSGCLLCGSHHHCSNHLGDNKCPLAHTDEGGLCCTISGYCLPTLNLSEKEFVEHVQFATHHELSSMQSLSVEEIYAVVKWFLLGGQSQACKRDEISKLLTKYQFNLIKNLKQRKHDPFRKQSPVMPCIVSAIAHALHSVRPKHIKFATEDLCVFCSTQIFKCLKSIQLNNVQGRKVNVVIGMLYLMKQGLVVQNIQWLPKVTSLSECLPHETSLEKTFQLCMKLVCETENEIKLALRQRIHLT